MIVTRHIQAMLVEAEILAQDAEKITWPEEQVLFNLERAANLAEHAAAELKDEWLKARERWGRK